MGLKFISEADRLLTERAVEDRVLAVSYCDNMTVSTKVVMMAQV